MPERVVVVTGASGGLGPSVVEAFRKSGDTVVEVARSTPRFRADLTSPEETAKVIEAIVDEHGRIDVLVHVTGAFAADGTVAEGKLDTWRRMMDVNFHSALHVVRAVVPVMLRGEPGGRIIAIGSRAGVQPSAGVGAYSVSKAALHTLIQVVAAELKENRITVNAVLPGTIDTAANRGSGTPEQAAKWVRPESIAEVVLWLASDAAADVSGALIPVYGRS